MKSPALSCLCLSALVLTAGCGKTGSKYPTVPATVTVTYKGSPVEGANVQFVNSGTYSTPVVAIGRTDAQGKAVMNTPESGPGVIKGIHLVTINKYDMPAVQAAADTESEDYNPDAGPTYAPPKSLIPAKYAGLASGLTVEVGDSPIDKTFDLVD